MRTTSNTTSRVGRPGMGADPRVSTPAAPGFMRAVVAERGVARLEPRRPRPTLGEGEALVRVTRAAVARLEVEVASGLLGFAGVPGCDGVGVVESGGGRKLAGKRVVFSPVISCGRCALCTRGLPTHCRKREIIGLQGRDGVLAEFVRVPVRNLIEVPADVDDDRAAFAHAVGAALQASRQLRLEGKPYITVLGDGHLGLIAVQIMARLNASVRLLGRFSEKLALCEKWGVKHRHIDDVGRRADQDIVVDCTGTPSGIELAMRLVRPRGKILLKTLMSPSTLQGAGPAGGVDLSPLVASEVELIGSFGGSVSDGLAMIEQGQVDVVSLITRRMRLDEGPAILRAASSPESICVLVTP